jgi:hypothetical protein
MESTENQQKQSSLNPSNLFIVLFAAVITPIVLVLLFNSWANEGVSWEQLQNVPENAAEVVSYGDWFTIFIRSEENKYFECELDFENLECTETTSNSIEAHHDLCAGKKSAYPYPPGNVISHTDFHLCGPDMVIDLNYVVLDDGSVWELRDGTHALTLFLRYCIIGIGVILGAVVGLLINRNRKLRGNHKSENIEA